ncbi:MAG TPA: cupin domain-containing protein [Baekduia sp.]|nr:cupin domain-containing protein [Baekduia sp.]
MPPSSDPSAASFAVTVDDLELEPWPLEPEQVVAGSPEVSGVVLHTSADGRVERGVWQHTAGTSRDVEADELFVVLRGRATIEVEDGPTLEVGPGDAGILRAGDRTVWTVHETVRKVFQTTS